NKFGVGMLKDGWDTNYYSFAGDNNTYHKFITYSDANQKEELSKLWGTWWGGSWMRAGISGYPDFGTGDLLNTAGGELPDFRTESEDEVEVPTFLQNKWKTEGTYDEKMNDLNQWFTSTGNTKRVRNYLCYWLSSYVEEYGIDGFRCDTAKHVEKDSWAALKDSCVKALNTWRENNPTKAGADWDEDFWMTGEVYGKGLSNAKDAYFTEGKFDSTINFAFSGGGGVSAVSTINETYEKYAENINTADNYNVLTYISSHDTKLCGRDKSTDSYSAEKLIYQGSALQLLPGGIQIFYGDETGRKYFKHEISAINSIVTSGNHDVRSFMNWDSIDNEILTHWQKVGTFRNNHISVGAGSHKTLASTSGAAFERYYDKNGIKDKVVACIGADADKNVTITVNTADFPDGTILKNTYDNTTAMVYNGKVTFNSGANGTILCEVAGTGEVVRVEGVTLSNTTASIYTGKTVNLSATVTPENATAPQITWSSSDNSVATVDENGVVKGVKSGTAVITATADGVSAQCTVTVKQYVTSVKLNATAKTLYTGASTTLKATVAPTNASNKKVTWKSSNTGVATVSQTGKVVAKKRGTCTVTATSADGSKKSAKCVITVKQKVTKVTVSQKTVTLKKKGKTATVKATAYPSDANVKTLSVKVTNTKIAKASATKIASGKTVKITAKKKGKTTITFTSTDGSKKSATCTVKVQK
ncbi:MAG: Ig-like domain-containing protein, partial [Ruminococcus sp.]